MYSRLACIILLMVHFSRCTHGFMCQIVKVPRGLAYAGKTEKVDGIAVGYSARFQCYDVYEDSLTRLTCVKAETWSAPSPPCKWIKCGAPPPVINGRMEITGWKVGDHAVISCHEGFWYTGDNPRICERNRTWSGRDGHCQEVSCPTLEGLDEGDFHPLPPYKYNSSLKAYCNPGFVYNGSKELVCLRNNKWGGTVGQCLDKHLIRCPIIRQIGNIILNPAQQEYSFHEKIFISCPVGFSYNGTIMRTCQVDGSWSGQEGNCNIKTCPPYVPVGVGWVEPACSPCEYRDTVRVVCPQGYNYNGTELTCDEHGRWTGTKKNCTAVQCDDPVVPDGHVNGSGFVYKDEANIRCDPGYTWVGDYPQALCDSDGTWVIHGNCSVLMDFPSAFADSNKSRIAAAVCVPLVLVVLVIAGLFFYRRCQRRRMPEPNYVLSERPKGTKSDRGEKNIVLIREEEKNNTSKCQDQDFKDEILKYGHVTNRELDKKVNLDIQFITLRLVSGNYSCTKNDILPDRYQDDLQKTGAQNIEIKDLLKYVKFKTVTNENDNWDSHKRDVDGDVKLNIDKCDSYVASLQQDDNIPNSEKMNLIDRSDVASILEGETATVKKKSPLLLVGRGGVGKSTLVQKLMRLWAQNRWASEYKAAFLFNMRSLAVLDKRPVSLVDFLRNFGVYMLREKTEEFIFSTLKNNGDEIIIFMDGVDETPLLATKFGEKRKDKKNKKTEPITWCLDILRRDVLGESVLILASRPFRELAAFKCNPVLEVVGLTHDAILQFINCHVGQGCETEEEKTATIERVRKAMTGNKLVMSVSAITYFCMLFCQVLEEDENVSMEELNTYTRITTFFIQKYLYRNPIVHPVKPVIFLPHLTHLSYNGLMNNGDDNDIAQLVFHKVDVNAVHLTEEHVNQAGNCGILLIHSVPEHMADMLKPDACYEFVHLSVQELLAMMELSQKDTDTLIKTAEMMWGSSSFNMAKMYLYGLQFDRGNINIINLRQMMPKVEENHETDQRIVDDRLVDILIRANNDESADAESGDETKYLLEVLQVTYETQNHAVVKEVADRMFKGCNKLKLSETLLTAIDINAIIFMLEHTKNIDRLCLTEVTIDETCVELLSDYLKVDTHLTELSMEGTKLSSASLRNILENFGYRAHQNSLNLSMTGIDETSMSVLVDELPNASFITTLSMLELDKKDFLYVAEALMTNKFLHYLRLQCSENLYKDAERTRSVMNGLQSNKTLDIVWLAGDGSYTNTLVCIPGSGRRVSVEAGSSHTYINAWTPADITSSKLFYDEHVEWGGHGLVLNLNDEFSSIYGEDRPVVSPDVWSQILQDVTHCKHSVRGLEVNLSPYSPLTPLLTSITSHWEALLDIDINRVDVWFGKVTCCDLHTWYTSLTTQQGWSSEGRYDNEDKAVGAVITNTHGKYLIIKLTETKILSSRRHSRHYLQQVPGLLKDPKWGKENSGQCHCQWGL